MSSSFAPTPPIRHTYSKQWQGKLIPMAVLLAIGMGLTSCDRAASEKSNHTNIKVLADKVIVDSSLIHTSNPERYQPSYNLEGALIPVDIFKIVTPYSANELSVSVKEGDWVKKGQVLAVLNTQIDTNKARFIQSEFIDALIEGEKNINVNTRQTTNKEEPSSLSKRGKVQPVTLVFKSPTEGQVTKINPEIKAEMETATHQVNPQINSKSYSTESASDSAPTAESPVFNYSIPAETQLMTIADTRHLQLIGKLPLSTESQLSVGRPVNFTVFDVNTEFTGQISHITPDVTAGYVIVRAPLISSDDNEAVLEPGMRAAMTIDYGQTELGVRLPKQAIHDANLEKLTAKHPRPTTPIHGFVWVIKQDQRLSYTPVEVVQYFADSDKYLVHGINNDSLVCLADLPIESNGKLISVK